MDSVYVIINQYFQFSIHAIIKAKIWLYVYVWLSNECGGA